MNMGMHLTRSARWFAERTAIVHRDVRLTYREFNERVNRLANGLISLGFKKGEHVAFFSANRHHILEGVLRVSQGRACHGAP